MPDIAILPTPEEDRWGDPIPGTGEPRVIRDVMTWPRESTERPEGPIVTGIWAWFEPDQLGPADLTAIDAVLVGIEVGADGTPIAGTGTRYEVDGEPGEYRWDPNERAGTQVALRKARG